MSDLTTLVSELREIAADAEALQRQYGIPDIVRLRLIHLLQDELRSDLTAPGARLWLNTVADDIVALLDDFYATTAVEIAGRLRDVIGLDAEELRDEREPFLCLDCAVNTADLGEAYMIRDRVWLEANPGNKGMLCIGCLEARLARRLVPRDFVAAPINGEPMSERLRARIFGLEGARAT